MFAFEKMLLHQAPPHQIKGYYYAKLSFLDLASKEFITTTTKKTNTKPVGRKQPISPANKIKFIRYGNVEKICSFFCLVINFCILLL